MIIKRLLIRMITVLIAECLLVAVAHAFILQSTIASGLVRQYLDSEANVCGKVSQIKHNPNGTVFLINNYLQDPDLIVNISKNITTDEILLQSYLHEYICISGYVFMHNQVPTINIDSINALQMTHYRADQVFLNTKMPRVTLDQVASHVNQLVQLCAILDSMEVDNNRTYLFFRTNPDRGDLGTPLPTSIHVIWWDLNAGRHTDLFQYVNHPLCVRGEVRSIKGDLIMNINHPAQVELYKFRHVDQHTDELTQ